MLRRLTGLMEGTDLVYSYKRVGLGKEPTKSSKFEDSELSDMRTHLEKVTNTRQ